jgi:hypothetical protein
VQSQVGQALDRQAAAVRAGDQQAFLAPAATADTGLRATLSRRFAALRALQVAKWEEAVAGTPTPAPGGSWTVPVRLRYCFATPDCLPIPATVQTTWIESGGALTMTAFGTVATADLGPRPWEVSDLRVAAGKRVVLATTQRYAAKLPSMLAAAERAATAADRYARWGAKPARYFVFLAGPTEWGNWYGIPEAGWAAGYAVPITDRYSEIVLNGGRVESNEVGDVLRHEFTHVVTLVGVHRTYPGAWWMMEGLAEYVRAGPVAVGEYSGLAEGRRYVRSGRWDGDVTVDEPGADASTADANGRYAVAYLAVRRLAERFGENRMLDFFAAVVRDGATVEQASVSVLGAQWPDVAADATRSVRRAVA